MTGKLENAGEITQTSAETDIVGALSAIIHCC